MCTAWNTLRAGPEVSIWPWWFLERDHRPGFWIRGLRRRGHCPYVISVAYLVRQLSQTWMTASTRGTTLPEPPEESETHWKCNSRPSNFKCLWSSVSSYLYVPFEHAHISNFRGRMRISFKGWFRFHRSWCLAGLLKNHSWNPSLDNIPRLMNRCSSQLWSKLLRITLFPYPRHTHS